MMQFRRKKKEKKFDRLGFPVKSRKKSERSALEASLDRIFSLYIRHRDKCCHRCRREWDIKKLYNHHIFTRAHRGTRWDEEACIAVCFSCHEFAHSFTEEFRDWVIGWMGQKEYDRLKVKAMGRVKFTESDLTMILFDLKKKLKELSK